MNFLAAFDDPEVFGPHFAGPSWDTWRAGLKAAHGLPLDDAELELFRAVADRDPPTRRVKELWVVAGRRAGKDSVVSAMATFPPLYSRMAVYGPAKGRQSCVWRMTGRKHGSC